MDRSPTETRETVAMSAESMVGLARERLEAALKLLGSSSEVAVPDDVVVGAGILAHEAGDALEELFEHRLAKALEEEEEGGNDG
ncbi:MAG: hypothetical protein ACRBN8_46850 [Nannocystales bacterium]